jgi:hypothetical protein
MLNKSAGFSGGLYTAQISSNADKGDLGSLPGFCSLSLNLNLNAALPLCRRLSLIFIILSYSSFPCLTTLAKSRKMMDDTEANRYLVQVQQQYAEFLDDSVCHVTNCISHN